MKSHLITMILAFIAGAAVSFVAINIILPATEDFIIKTVDIDSSASLSDPNIEIFNYRAINPTVEVYVGDGNEEPELEPELEPEPEPEPTPEENENGTTD